MASFRQWLTKIANQFTGALIVEEIEFPSEILQNRKLFLSATLLLSFTYIYSLITVLIFPNQFSIIGFQMFFIGLPVFIFYIIGFYKYHQILEWIFVIWLNLNLFAIFLFIELEPFHLMYLLLPIFVIILLHGNNAGFVALIFNIVAAFLLAEESGNFSGTSIFGREILIILVLSSVTLAMNYHKGNVHKSDLIIRHAGKIRN